MVYGTSSDSKTGVILLRSMSSHITQSPRTLHWKQGTVGNYPGFLMRVWYSIGWSEKGSERSLRYKVLYTPL